LAEVSSCWPRGSPPFVGPIVETGAIPAVRSEHRGVVKAKLNTKRCLPLVGQAAGCSVCMKVCPVQRFGLTAVVTEYTASGRILGKDTDDLEGYDWPLDGRHYGPGVSPRLPRELMQPPGFEFDPSKAAPTEGAPSPERPGMLYQKATPRRQTRPSRVPI
jgi:epoxyqueuosine reductase